MSGAVRLAFRLFEPSSVHVSPGATPVTVLHGMLGSARNWISVARRMADRLRRKVYVLDARNHGGSPHVPDISYDLMAADTLSFLEREGLTRTVLTGHSMGGRTAMLVALRHASLVERLVVLDVSPVNKPVRGEGVGGIVRALRELDLSRLQSRKQADDMLREKLPEQSLRDFLLTNLVMEGGCGSGRSSLRWKVNLEAMDKALPSLVVFPEVGGATYPGPTLFLGGTESDMIGPETIPGIRVLFPQATVRHVAGAGHLLHVEKPDDVISIVSDFISS